jgi:nitrate reductase beta subunit
MYRLLAIAKYDERYVIPAAHAKDAAALEAQAAAYGDCPVGAGDDFHLTENADAGLFRRTDGRRGLTLNPLRGRS